MSAILICPDDQDFSCTVIVTKVISEENKIRWHRFGIDKSYEFGKPELIGTNVIWFSNECELIFNKKEYIQAFNILLKK
jgi:hypothetical protein